MKNKKSRIVKNKIASILIGLFLLPLIALAMPTPHGIDGVIFDLDGLTEAQQVSFSIENTANGKRIEGVTGYGSPGRYSASIKGENGNLIIIKAWNRYNNVNATVSLNGVMRGLDLYLNLSYPALPPEIISQPTAFAWEDSLFLYQIIAIDENKDVLYYDLVEAPISMMIQEKEGFVEWHPTQNDVGMHYISIRVSDGIFEQFQNFTLMVENVNDVPKIYSLPTEEGMQDNLYQYQVGAFDEDNDTVLFSLTARPYGMSINPATGLVQWVPTNEQHGIHHISIMANDSSAAVFQNYSLFISNVNDLPSIVSIPITVASEDELYAYDVDAVDIDNDSIIFSLTTGPQGMEIQPQTGIITWIPNDIDFGQHTIVVRASDNTGYTEQVFNLIAESINDAPVITSSPLEYAVVLRKYRYDVQSFDEENDVVHYRLLEKPWGMGIQEKTGVIEWVPRLFQERNHDVAVLVSDGIANDTQKFTINVARGRQLQFQEDDLENERGKVTQNAKQNNFESGNTFDATSNELSIQKLPSNIKSPGRPVYSYLSKQQNTTDMADSVYLFNVSKGWLLDLEIEPVNIVLSHYINGEWTDSKAIVQGETDSFVMYAAAIIDAQLYAVTIAEGASFMLKDESDISRATLPYIVAGTIYTFKGAEVPRGTPITVVNHNSNASIGAKTGMAADNGAFAVVMHGQDNDPLTFMIGSLNATFDAALHESREFDFALSRNGRAIIPITGYSILVYPKIDLAATGLLAIGILAIALLWLRRTTYHKNSRN